MAPSLVYDMINLQFPAFYFIILPNRNILGHYVTYVSYITICYHTPAIEHMQLMLSQTVFLGHFRQIVGDAGSGKTVLTKQIFAELAQNQVLGPAWGLGNPNCWANASEQVQYGNMVQYICMPSAKQFHCLWHLPDAVLTVNEFVHKYVCCSKVWQR